MLHFNLFHVHVGMHVKAWVWRSEQLCRSLFSLMVGLEHAEESASSLSSTPLSSIIVALFGF